MTRLIHDVEVDDDGILYGDNDGKKEKRNPEF